MWSRSRPLARMKMASSLTWLCLLAAAVALAGCSGKTYPFAKGRKAMVAGLTKTPPPFYLASLGGMPRAKSARLFAYLVDEARKRNITFATKPSSKAFVMSGHFSAAPAHGGVALAYVWDIRATRRTNRYRISGSKVLHRLKYQQVWPNVDDRILARIARETAQGLSGWLSKQNYRTRQVSLPPPGLMSGRKQPGVRPGARLAQRPQRPIRLTRVSSALPVYRARARRQIMPKAPLTTSLITPRPPVRRAPKQIKAVLKASPQSPNPPRQLKGTAAAGGLTTGSIKPQKYALTVYVKPVTARGHTIPALTRNMMDVLRARGIGLVAVKRRDAMTLAGYVRYAQAANGKQRVMLTWNVLGPNGARLGIVSQSNDISTAAARGNWGEEARLAVAAAADGIIGLLHTAKR